MLHRIIWESIERFPNNLEIPQVHGDGAAPESCYFYMSHAQFGGRGYAILQGRKRPLEGRFMPYGSESVFDPLSG